MGHIDQWMRNNPGQAIPVTYILASDPESELEGAVKEIQATAELRPEHGNTVLFRVEIDKDKIKSDAVTEGTDVTAKLYCGQQAIGYVWFHDLIDWCRKLLFKL